jgi:uncharacterized protein (DUF433 family)
MTFDRITRSVDVVGGKPCIRGTRVTVGTIVGLIATGSTVDDITTAYPYLTNDDIRHHYPTPPGAWKRLRSHCLPHEVPH